MYNFLHVSPYTMSSFASVELNCDLMFGNSKDTYPQIDFSLYENVYVEEFDKEHL